MEKKTYNEILEILKSKIEDVSNFAYEDYDSEELELGEIKEIHQHGGEGEGDYWESVKYFKDHDIYIKVEGFYQSYNGTEFYGNWKCASQVIPKEKIITVYDKVQ